MISLRKIASAFCASRRHLVNVDIQPICLVTIGRSGGTAFMHALGQHPDVIIPPSWPHEDRPAGVACFQHKEELKALTDTERQESSYSKVFVHDPWLQNSYRKAVLETAINAVIIGISETYSHIGSGRFFMEKTLPEDQPFLKMAYGGCQTVLLVRDPVDSFVSALKFFSRQPNHHYFTGNVDPLDSLMMSYFGRYFQNISEILKTLGGQNEVVLAKYENMVADSETFFGEILDSLGLDNDEENIARCCRGYIDAGKRKAHSTSRELNKSINRGESELEPAEIDKIMDFTADYRRLFGYRAG